MDLRLNSSKRETNWREAAAPKSDSVVDTSYYFVFQRQRCSMISVVVVVGAWMLRSNEGGEVPLSTREPGSPT